jgi:hypothetical protein
VLQTEHELIGRPTFYKHRAEQNQRVDHAAHVPESGKAVRHLHNGLVDPVLDTRPHQVDPFVHIQKCTLIVVLRPCSILLLVSPIELFFQNRLLLRD